jgi:hypothetical protein
MPRRGDALVDLVEGRLAPRKPGQPLEESRRRLAQREREAPSGCALDRELRDPSGGRDGVVEHLELERHDGDGFSACPPN